MSLVQQEFVICLNVYIKSVGSKSVGKRIAFSVILPIEYGHVWSYKELNRNRMWYCYNPANSDVFSRTLLTFNMRFFTISVALKRFAYQTTFYTRPMESIKHKAMDWDCSASTKITVSWFVVYSPFTWSLLWKFRNFILIRLNNDSKMEINPLSANAESTTDDKVVTSDSCWTQCRFRENVNFDKSDFKFASFGSKVMGKK